MQMPHPCNLLSRQTQDTSECYARSNIYFFNRGRIPLSVWTGGTVGNGIGTSSPAYPWRIESDLQVFAGHRSFRSAQDARAFYSTLVIAPSVKVTFMSL